MITIAAAAILGALSGFALWRWAVRRPREAVDVEFSEIDVRTVRLLDVLA